MGLLTPLFLLAGLAVAIPLVVHLRRRDRANVVVFPSLMFLRGGPPPTAKRRRLQHLALLAARCAVVLLLALAFARPFVGRANATGADGPARDVIILLDRSPSMLVGDRWLVAIREAEREITAMRGEDRATIIAFADGADALSELTDDPTLLRAALAEVRPVGGATRYAPAVQLAGRMLAEQGRGRGELVIVGDLQRTGWVADELDPLPAGTIVRASAVESSGAMPPAIRELTVTATADGSRELRTVTASLDSSASGVSYRLELDGRIVETVVATPSPDGSAEARFTAVPIPDRPVRAMVRAASGAAGPDSGARAILERGRRRDVLVLRGTGAARGEFAATALRSATTSPVAVTVQRGALPPDTELARYTAVVVDDAPITVADAGRLRAWVERGGGLVLATPASTETRASGMTELSGLRGATRMQRAQGTVASVDAGHPAFALTGVPARDLVGARVTQYAAREEAAEWTTFARLDDGSAALAERRLGRGRVVVWSAGFDESSGALVRHPIFQPLVHALALYAGGLAGEAVARRPGDAIDLAAVIADDPAARADPPAEGERLTLAAPDGERTPVPVRNGVASARLDRAGFYEVRRAAADAEPRAIAVNVDPAEYAIESISELDLVATLAPAENADAAASLAGPALLPPDLDRRQRLWWWLLAAVAGLLAIEVIVANRLSRPHVVAPVSGRRS